MDEEIIKGTFYEQELVKYEDDSCEINKIIRREKNRLLENEEVDILENNIKIDDKLYELGEEEWKLLTRRDPGGLKDYSEAAWKIIMTF